MLSDIVLGERRIKLASGYIDKCREIVNYNAAINKFGSLLMVVTMFEPTKGI